MLFPFRMAWITGMAPPGLLEAGLTQVRSSLSAYVSITALTKRQSCSFVSETRIQVRQPVRTAFKVAQAPVIHLLPPSLCTRTPSGEAKHLRTGSPTKFE